MTNNGVPLPGQAPPEASRTCGCSGITELLAVSIVWAFSFGLIRNTLAGVDPLLVACLRLLLASLVTLPFIRLQGLSRRAIVELLLIGAVQFGLMYAVYIDAFGYLEAWEVAMLTVTTPVMVVAFDRLMEKRGRAAFLWASIAALAGGAVILWGRPVSTGFWRGMVLVQLSNLFFASGQVAFRIFSRDQSAPAKRTSEVIGLMHLGGFLATLPGAIPAAAGIASLSVSQIAALCYLGVVASGIGFMVWNQGATKVNAGVLAGFNNAKIPLSVLASMLLIGERPSILKLSAGALLISAGIAFGRRGRRSRPADSSGTGAMHGDHGGD